MGSLLSSEPPPPPASNPRREFSTPFINTERVSPPRPSLIITNNSFRQESESASRHSGRVPSYHGTIRVSNSISRTSRNPFDELTNKFYTLTMHQCIQQCRWSLFSNEIEFVELFEGTAEYNAIKNRFSRSLRLENPTIIKIEKVKNYILMGQYLLKKQEYQCKNVDFQEKHYYHGTKQNNMISICRENFNWRITNRNKFGKGVSFAPSSSYAIHYCDKKPYKPKVMFVAKVLIGESCLGFENMQLPRTGSDTSMKNDGKVIVKFYDNEFYPEYLIHFYAKIIQHNKLNHN